MYFLTNHQILARTIIGRGFHCERFTAFYGSESFTFFVYSQTLWRGFSVLLTRGRTCFLISLNVNWSCDFLRLKECHRNDDMPVLSLSLEEPCPLVLLVFLLRPWEHVWAIHVAGAMWNRPELPQLPGQSRPQSADRSEWDWPRLAEPPQWPPGHVSSTCLLLYATEALRAVCYTALSWPQLTDTPT